MRSCPLAPNSYAPMSGLLPRLLPSMSVVEALAARAVPMAGLPTFRRKSASEPVPGATNCGSVPTRLLARTAFRSAPPDSFTEGVLGLSLSKNRLPAHSVPWLPPPSIIAVLLPFTVELATAMLLYHFTSLLFTQLSSPRQVALLVLSQLLW